MLYTRSKTACSTFAQPLHSYSSFEDVPTDPLQRTLCTPCTTPKHKYQKRALMHAIHPLSMVVHGKLFVMHGGMFADGLLYHFHQLPFTCPCSIHRVKLCLIAPTADCQCFNELLFGRIGAFNWQPT